MMLYFGSFQLITNGHMFFLKKIYTDQVLEENVNAVDHWKATSQIAKGDALYIFLTLFK